MMAFSDLKGICSAEATPHSRDDEEQPFDQSSAPYPRPPSTTASAKLISVTRSRQRSAPKLARKKGELVLFKWSEKAD